jgi:hypothetical protein
MTQNYKLGDHCPIPAGGAIDRGSHAPLFSPAAAFASQGKVSPENQQGTTVVPQAR